MSEDMPELDPDRKDRFRRAVANVTPNWRALLRRQRSTRADAAPLETRKD